MAQADMFLKLSNIKGESQDTKHPDEIEVLSWSWGASQEGTAHTGSGSGAGKVHVQDLSFTHHLDAASSDLMKYLVTGKHIDQGMLTARKAGGNSLEYYKLKLEQVYVSHISQGGSDGSHQVTENVTLNFRKFTEQYTAQDPKGGPKPSAPFSWDIAKATE